MKIKKNLTFFVLVAAVFALSATGVFADSGGVNIAEGAAYVYPDKTPIQSNGGDAEAVKLTDGVFASTNSLWNGEWVVFDSNASACAATVRVDLGEIYSVTAVATRFLQDVDSGAFPPVSFKVSAGVDAESLTEVASGSYETEGLTGTDAIEFEKVLESKMNARYVEIQIEGLAYSWNTYFGIDEIIVTGGAETGTSEEESDAEPAESSENIPPQSEGENSSVDGSLDESAAAPAESTANPVSQSETPGETPGEQSTPDTGDDINSVFYTAIAIMFLAAFTVAVCRRKFAVR